MKRGSQEDELVFLNRRDKKDRVFSQEKMRTSKRMRIKEYRELYFRDFKIQMS